jgi:tetratricopeptide (TPR) repeat protein
MVARTSPGEYFKVAKYYYDAGDYHKALPEINKVIATDSSYAGAFYLRALVQYELGNYEISISDSQMAIGLVEKESSAHAEYLVLRARARYALGVQDNALNDINSAILLSGTNPEAFLVRACIKKAIQDYRGAIADLNYAIETFNPAVADYYALRAQSVQEYYHPKHGDPMYSEVLTDLDRAIELDPDHYAHFVARSAFYLSNKQIDHALTDLSTMILNHPGRHEAYMLRGKILMEHYQYTEAIEDFTHAIALQPDDEKLYRYRALCYHNSGMLRAARQDLSEAITLLSERVVRDETDQHRQIVLAETYIQRGLVTTQINNTTGSCQDFLSARELGVQKGNYYYSKFCNKW